MIFYEVLDLVLDFIYPKNISCILCNKPIKKINTYSLCKDCFKELNFIQDGCIKCGKPIIYHSLEKLDLCGCSYCFNKSFYFDKAISCIEYSDISKSMILGFKYKNKTYMAKYISNIMKEKLELGIRAEDEVEKEGKCLSNLKNYIENCRYYKIF